jgi:omega-6 fatty acid desaturase (delta-12 desaturase)
VMEQGDQETAGETAGESARESAKRWSDILRPWGRADARRSMVQLLTSGPPFFLCWYASYRALSVSYWLSLALAVPTAVFLTRLFMIQHDCGHGSFFKSQNTANRVGFWIGVLTLTPYRYWRRTHAYHHAHSGDLGFRGFGDIDLITVREYYEMPFLGRLRYRAYRHPAVFLGLGGVFVFVLKHRFPWDIPRRWRREWRSVWKTNAALAGIALFMWLTIGLKTFAVVHLPVLLLTVTPGVWLFYVQHQFEDTYWREHENWGYVDANLRGSSHLVLPKVLQWVTASIGIHHVHHLNAKIPNYRLQECLDSNPELQGVTKLTPWEAIKTLNLSLWHEDSKRLVSFTEAKGLAAP